MTTTTIIFSLSCDKQMHLLLAGYFLMMLEHFRTWSFLVDSWGIKFAFKQDWLKGSFEYKHIQESTDELSLLEII